MHVYIYTLSHTHTHTVLFFLLLDNWGWTIPLEGHQDAMKPSYKIGWIRLANYFFGKCIDESLDIHKECILMSSLAAKGI